MDYRNKLKQQIESLCKNKIHIKIHTAQTDIDIGQSKFGGKPHLPKDFQWYYYNGEGLDKKIKNRPLSFLAQINCREIHFFDKDNLLPAEGILYFFYELDTMSWGYDPRDVGSARVYYFSGSEQELIETEFPEDLEEDYRMPEFAVEFSSVISMPDYQEAEDLLDNQQQSDFDGLHSRYGMDINCTEQEDLDGEADFDIYDTYEEIRKELGYEPPSDTLTGLLGYAELIQNPIPMECELVSNGFYAGRGWPKMSEKEKTNLIENMKEWVLLFQLDTVEIGDFCLMFGDCGSIYYYIRRQDLENLRFDKVWLVLQCY